jgi:hypothetical protein
VVDGLQAFGKLAPETQAAWWFLGRNQEVLGFHVFDCVIRLDHASQAVAARFRRISPSRSAG